MSEKVALITGASSGIGAATAKRLAKMGCANIVLVSRRKPEMDKVAQECRDAGAKDVLVLVQDLAAKPAEGAEAIMRETIAKFGRLDVLVCNAGLQFVSPARDLDVDMHMKAYSLMVHSPAMLTKFALPQLEKTKGNIIYVTSIIGDMATRGGSSYGACKAALRQYAKTVALEEAANGIRVNCVSPGMTATELLRAGVSNQAGQEIP